MGRINFYTGVRPGDRQGFTLIEILMVVVLFSIVTMMAIPNMGSTFHQMQLRQTADDIAYLMRYAQSRAVTKGKVCRINFDPEAAKYWLTQEVAQEDRVGATASFEPVSGRLGRAATVPPEVELDPELTTLDFQPDGRIEKKRFWICRKEKCLTISTQGQRGYVDVQEGKILE